MKYGAESGGWFTKIPKGSYGVSLWKVTKKEIDQIKLNSSFSLEVAVESISGKIPGKMRSSCPLFSHICTTWQVQRGLWLQIYGTTVAGTLDY